MNKSICGKQYTILWHINYIKVSHVDSDVVTSVLEKIDSINGKVYPITLTMVELHDYLGMKIDFIEKVKIKFSEIDYINNILEGIPDDMKSKV